MKFGFRVPSLGRSVRAATTSKVVRAAKSAANPLYGNRGIGFIRDPERSTYNAVYNRITFDARRLIMADKARRKKGSFDPAAEDVSLLEEPLDRIESPYRSVKGATNIIETADGRFYRMLWSFKGLWKPSDEAFSKRMATLFEALGNEDVSLKPGSNGEFILSIKVGNALVSAHIMSSSVSKVDVAHVRNLKAMYAGSDVDSVWMISRHGGYSMFTKKAAELFEEEGFVFVDLETIEDLIAQEAIRSKRLISSAEKDALIEKYNANNYWYQAD